MWAVFIYLTALLTCWNTRAIAANEGEQSYIPESALISSAGLCSAIVNNSVNVISGQFIDSNVDLTIPGIEPLVLARTHLSNDFHYGLGSGCYFNHATRLILEAKSSNFEDPTVIHHAEPSGGHTIYGTHLKHRDAVYEGICMMRTRPSRYYTNTGGIIGAANWLPNAYAIAYFGDECQRCDVFEANGSKRFYDSYKAKNTTHCSHYCELLLREHRKTNGHSLHYKYDKTRSLKTIAVHDVHNRPYSKIDIHYKEKSYDRVFSASDGRKVSYKFKKHRFTESYRADPDDKESSTRTLEAIFLSDVDSPEKAPQHYSYEKCCQNARWHIIKKEWGNDRHYLSNSYYHPGTNSFGMRGTVQLTTHMRSDESKRDFRFDRVRLQEAPVGPNSNPVITHYYDYHQKPDGSGLTYVYDAYQNLTAYHYDDRKRLTQVLHFNTHNAAHHVENYAWNDAGQILAKVDTDGLDRVHLAHSFAYDDNGNITCDTTIGNLSGRATDLPVLPADHLPDSQSSESYKNWFRYGPAPYHLLLAEGQDDGTEIHYRYNENSTQLKAKYLIFKDQCLWREFRKYDHNGLCTAEITDDGSSRASIDLTDVTCRKIIRRSYSKHHDIENRTYGAPTQVDHLYLDLNTGQEVLLRQCRYQYDRQGRVTSCEFYKSDGTYSHTLEYQYDDHGNCIFFKDGIGRITKRTYNLFDNLTKETLPDGQKVYHSHDYTGRVIRTVVKGSDGLSLTTTHRYDWLSQCIATIDPYGRETKFDYDPFGHVIRKHHPSTQDGTVPTQQWEYDTLGNPTTLTDALGRVTRQKFNSRGQVIESVAPDGSTEQRYYHLNGRLATTIQKDGITIHYAYDAFGNIISQEEYAPDGSFLSRETWVWRDHRLLSHVDTAGCLTTYTYDGAGRRQTECCDNRHVTYSYDTRGYLCQEHRADISHPESLIIKRWKYDSAGRLLHESVSDYADQLQHSIAYTYDSMDRCTHTVKTMTTPEGEVKATTITTYDSLGRIVSITDPDGNTTHNEYILTSNGRGAQTLTTATTDPLGNQIVKEHDAFDRVIRTKQLDPLGNLLSCNETTYDIAGKRLTASVFVIDDGKTTDQQTARWQYDDGDRVVEETYAWGDPKQYALHHTYDSYGRRIATLKPDGTQLFWQYDAKGRPLAISSSCNDVNYHYTYDQAGRVSKVTDSGSHTSVERSYDSYGNITSENLGNGNQLNYSYDALSRPTQVCYPDGSAAHYSYRGQHLSTILRTNPKGEPRYQYSYQAYNQEGHPLQAQLPGSAGEIRWKYDRCGRLLAVDSNHFQLKIAPNDYDACGNLLGCIQTDPDGTVNSHWTYDALYQLTSEEGLATHQYQYASNGNRTAVDGEHWQHDIHNRLLQAGEKHLQYDRNGNLIDDGQHQYRYDALDRLIAVSDEATTTTYQYDAFHRRLVRHQKHKGNTEDDEQFKEEFFLYIGSDEIGSTDGSGKIHQLRLLGTGLGAEIGASIAMEFDGVPYAPIHDQNGSVRCLIGIRDGSCAAYYRYDAFGNTTQQHGVQADACPWRFSSKRLDTESSLVYFGRRYYAPNLGRWMTLDPAGYDAGANGYLYVNNNPLTHCDLYGLIDQSTFQSFDYGSQWYNEFQNRSSNTPPRTHNFHFYFSPITKILSCIGSVISTVSYHLMPLPFVRDIFGLCGHFLQGNCLCSYQPSFNEYSSSWTSVGSNQNYPNTTIMLTNGMLNNMEDALHSAELISKSYCDERVVLLHNSSWGFIADFVECVAQKLGLPTYATRLQTQAFKLALKNSETVIAYAHSQGAIIVKSALQNLSPQERSRIHVRTFGAGTIIEPQGLKSAMNYVSDRDPVPFSADIIGMISALIYGHNHVCVLRSDCTLPIDHSFAGNTYQTALENTSKHFKKTIR
jgi:RHS repeat-associated protein